MMDITEYVLHPLLFSVYASKPGKVVQRERGWWKYFQCVEVLGFFSSSERMQANVSWFSVPDWRKRMRDNGIKCLSVSD